MHNPGSGEAQSQRLRAGRATARLGCSMASVLALAGLPMAVHGQPASPQRPPADPAAIAAELVQFNTYPSILTFDRPAGQVRERGIVVTSTSFAPNGELDRKYSGAGGSVSPQVSWTKGPPGTKSYVLAFEDGVANKNRVGITHWLAFNIPAGVTSIPEGASIKAKGLTTPIGTMREGANVDQTVSYTGMGGSPSGNNYHMQIFALDTLLNLPTGASIDQVWEAMDHHVLASGQSIAIYKRGPGPPQAAEDPQAAAVAAARAEAQQAANSQISLTTPTVVTIDRPQGQLRGSLTVNVPALSKWGPAGVFPKKYSGRGASLSPEVTWTAGPKGTKSYALFFEDGVANRNREGILHWLAFDIPANVSRLPEALSQSPKGMSHALGGMKEGRNVDGTISYTGMMGLPGAPGFHYHMQVFALDSALNLPSGATRDQVWTAMTGHVLARGQAVGTFQSAGPGQVNLPPAPTHF